MKIHSLNLRGVKGENKKSSLRHLFEIVCLDIVFVQETMVNSEKVREYFVKVLKE